MSTTPTYATDRRVGRVIAGYLAAGSHSQAKLAAHIGINRSAVSEAINGKRRWTLDDLLGAAEFLDVPISYLIDPDDPGATRMLGVRRSMYAATPLRTSFAPLTLIAAA